MEAQQASGTAERFKIRVDDKMQDWECSTVGAAEKLTGMAKSLGDNEHHKVEIISTQTGEVVKIIET